MNRKGIWLILILLLLVGCSILKKGEYAPTITSKDIYTGKEGLTMEFFENSPPDEVFENSPFPMSISLNNKGAYNIEGGYLSIGFEKEYMDIIEDSLISINDKVNFRDSKIRFDLKGKDIENVKGDKEVVTFNFKTKELSKTDPQSDLHTSLISVTSCYKYQTRAVETVCIDADVYGLKKREKSCEVKTISLDSQGGSVAVTKIESEMLPDSNNPSLIKPRFVITVKNLGNGQIIKGDDETIKRACSSDPIGYEDWNIVRAEVYLSTINEENKLDCDVTDPDLHNDGILNLKGNEDMIRCTYEDGFDEKKGSFSSPLHIILYYGYTDTVSKEVRIKKLS